MIINEVIENDIKETFFNSTLNFNLLKNSSILITGATGVIGRMLTKFLQYTNHKLNLNMELILLVRNKDRLSNIFDANSIKEFRIFEQDITSYCNYEKEIDYIIHGAGVTDSCFLIEKPVETIDITINGIKNILELAKRIQVKSFVFLSTMEIYGKLKDDAELTEENNGSLDLLSERSSYPESKRLAECLSYCYFKEYNVPIKIARLAQVLSSNINKNDNRMPIQFAKSVISKKNIVLQTEGKSKRCYIYITDAINALITLLLYGKNGEVYNIANRKTFCSILDIAQMLCKKFPGSEVQFEINDKKYPPTTYWNLNTQKLEQLGWQPNISLEEMFSRIINSLRYSYCL